MTMRRRSFLAALVAAGASPMLSRAGVRAAERAPRSVPMGTVIQMLGRDSAGRPVASTVILSDAGWLPCNGASLPRALYPELFAVMGTIYGGGGGDFSLPDARGEFLRGSVAARGW